MVRGGAFVMDKWRNLVPGDYVKIKNNEVIPADCILLTSSNNDGVAYIETASLDGEKNLKPKGSAPETV